MANVGPNIWYCSTVDYTAVTAWSASASVTAGSLIRPTAATYQNERVYCAIVGGTTGGTEPTWVVTKGAKTTDNTVTWIEVTGQPGVNGDTANSPTWTQNKSQALSQGLIIYDSVSGSLQIVTTAGTAGSGSQPSFSATAGATTADNTVTWTSLGLASNFGKLAAPAPRIYIVNQTNWAVGTNSFYVCDNYAETATVNWSFTSVGNSSAPIYIYSMDHTQPFPWGDSTRLAGASITTTGTQSLTFNGAVWVDGFTLTSGSGAAGSAALTINGAGPQQVWINCKFIHGTGNTANMSLSNGGNNCDTLFINTSVQFPNTTNSIAPGGMIRWRNSTVVAGATQPSSLLVSNAQASGVQFYACDFSNYSGTIFAGNNKWGYQLLQNCKLGASTTLANLNGSLGNPLDIINCDSAGTNYQFTHIMSAGYTQTDTTVYRANGATTPAGAGLSWKQYTGGGAVSIFSPFTSAPMLVWNTVTGSNVNVTLYGIHNNTGLYDRTASWIDVEYFGSSSSPISTIATTGITGPLNTSGTNSVADSSTWTGPTRANSTAYALNAPISLASNPGRVFFCTAAGTSAATEPAGYASAVDGGAVTDGTATFRAGVRFSITLTLTSPQPAMVGDLIVKYLRAQFLGTYTWIDPQPILS